VTTIEDDVDVSICKDCARHLSLKRIIEAKSVNGICARCCRDDVLVRDPKDLEPMVMLLRALIRYYWDEFDYNSHWGGNSAASLLEADDNPVVAPPVDDTYQDEFHFLLEEPGYPEPDKGIAIYGGFDEEGGPQLQFAISRSDPRILRDLANRLLTEKFDDVAPDLGALIAPALPDLTFTLPARTIGMRARVGVEATFQHFDGFNSEIRHQPYVGAAIGASPTPGHGRLNRAGEPVLYLASKTYTALAEIRPHPGHFVSVGGFETTRDLKLADFDPDIALFSQNEYRLDQYDIIQALDRLMSTPVIPEDKAGYLLTQLLTQVLKDKGFDGVQYRSSVSDGVNFCLFDTLCANFVDSHSAVHHIRAVSYDAPQSPSLLTPGLSDRKLDA
jgi:hypothetical protein|tara:strand:- start:5790 stop:6953 length:1164 start_codon:yes stop_codon:yes gene_type:complete